MRTCGLCGPASAAFTSSIVSGLNSRRNQFRASRRTVSRRISKIWRMSLALSYGVGMAAHCNAERKAKASPCVGTQSRRSTHRPRVRDLRRVERQAVVIGMLVVVRVRRIVDDERVGRAEVLETVPDALGN